MERPFSQDAFLMESVSFQEPRRRFIVTIAHRPNAKDARLRECPFDNRADRFTHKTTSPIRTRDEIAKIDSLIVPRSNRADQLVVLPAKDQPAI